MMMIRRRITHTERNKLEMMCYRRHDNTQRKDMNRERKGIMNVFSKK